MVSVAQESRHSLAGWFWFRISHKAAIQKSAGAVVSPQGLTGRGSSSKFIGCCQASGPYCQAVQQKHQFLTICKLTTWQLVSESIPWATVFLKPNLRSDNPSSLLLYLFVSSESLGPAHNFTGGHCTGYKYQESKIVLEASCHKV